MKISYISPVRTEKELLELKKKKQQIVLYSGLPAMIAADPIVHAVLNAKGNLAFVSGMLGISGGSATFFLVALGAFVIVNALPEKDDDYDNEY